jgi:dihydrofolate reductase
VIHTEDYRGRPGFHGWRHASARWADRGSDQGVQVRRLGDALFWLESGEELDRLFKKFDLLLGRKTYEIFAAYWPYYDEDASHGSIAKLFNDIKKYAVSRSGEIDTSWAGSVLLRDIADVKRLKQEDGPNLVTQGSTELVHALLANDLVDAMSIFTVPVVLGSGKKLFADGSAPHSFKLTRSRVSPNGLIVGHYEREGEIKIVMEFTYLQHRCPVNGTAGSHWLVAGAEEIRTAGPIRLEV